MSIKIKMIHASCVMVLVTVSLCIAKVCLSNPEANELEIANVAKIGDISKTSILNEFVTDSCKDTLLWYLSANIKWRVTEERGAVIAYKYDLDEKSKVRMEQNLDSPKGQSRIALRMGPYKYGENSNINRISFATAGDDTADVKLFKNANSAFFSELHLSGKGLYLQIMESSLDTNRTLTKETVSEVVKELESLKEKFDVGGRKAVIELLPKSSLGEKIEMEVFPGTQSGLYTVSGFINPGEPGFIEILVVDAETGSTIGEGINSLRTIEYIGWSSENSEKFYFQSPVTIFAPQDAKDEKKLKAIFKVLFYPTKARHLYESKPELVSVYKR